MKPLLPPPLYVLLCAVAMWQTAAQWPQLSWQFAGQSVIAAGVLLLGLALMGLAAQPMFARRTTLNPMQPARASTLLTTGVFALSRNPIYLGDLLVLLAYALWLGQPFNLLWLVAFVALLNRFQIRAEEAALSECFGEAYRQYCQRTRRWL